MVYGFVGGAGSGPMLEILKIEEHFLVFIEN